ncbi:hypothetical protein [Thermomonospora umbrina]|uniref:Uncharacterized protein n=1 Tax=Thermomonospora umbrina TaxID=111806 RepID=A0A3D9SX61_9ACTN|nr:hypothetical protein [Thermomonospora umbrina]REE96191.1 hypothetical protein DFJ69_1618 [Thermomonospora umbrina]
MDLHPESGLGPVYHGGEGGGGAITWPRMFALTAVPDEDDGEQEPVVACYGMEVPGGPAVTFLAGGGMFGTWNSAMRAAERLGLDLWWSDE